MNYYFEGNFHHKNQKSIPLMQEEGMNIDLKFNPEVKYDWIVSNNELKEFPNHDGGIIYGPSFLFPIFNARGFPLNNSVYFNLLSNWNKILCEEINPHMNCLALPFAVDVEKFIPKEKTGKPVIYFKHVDKNILDNVIRCLGDDFLIFDYHQGYEEDSFNDAISKAPYCIWVGRHESQGFAFQETLSTNTPIFVIDVKSLRDEIIPNQHTAWENFLPGHPLKATAASYFNEDCGMISYLDKWEKDFNLFLDKIDSYTPREFIINNLSPKSCADLWYNTLIQHYIK